MKIKKSITRNCLQCDLDIKVFPSRVKNGGGKFCSLSCSTKYRNLNHPELCARGSHEERFLRCISKQKKENGCWTWLGLISIYGYGRFIADHKDYSAHRYSYEYFKGKIPKGKVIMHICDNRSCVNPKHLKPGTYKDNILDMYSKGRAVNLKGSKHSMAKLTEKDVKLIRKRLINGEYQNSLAKEYGVSKATLCNIKKNKTWKHIL